MQSLEFLDLLLPGDELRGVPNFSAVVDSLFIDTQKVLWTRLDELLGLWRVQEAQGRISNINHRHIPSLIAFIKRADGDFYETLREEVLNHYLTRPIVLRGLGESLEPLFPRGQVLPTFPFDALETVYERGALWRAITTED